MTRPFAIAAAAADLLTPATTVHVRINDQYLDLIPETGEHLRKQLDAISDSDQRMFSIDAIWPHTCVMFELPIRSLNVHQNGFGMEVLLPNLLVAHRDILLEPVTSFPLRRIFESSGPLNEFGGLSDFVRTYMAFPQAR